MQPLCCKKTDIAMKNITLLLLLFIGTLALSAQSVKFTAEAQRAVIAGEKFQLVYTINTEATDLRLPQLDGFQILMGPSTAQSTSMTIINGQMERNTQYSYTYVLKANQPGKYSIAPATITVNGKKMESNTLQIDVIKSDEQAAKQGQAAEQDASVSADDLFITVTTNKREAYKDEPILITTKIYVRSVDLQGLSDIKNPELRDFISQELPRKGNIEWIMESYNGKNYTTGIYEQKLLFPQKAGTLQIEPTEIEFLVKQRVARRSTSVFDDFFESNFRTVKKKVSSKPIRINVKALPTPTPSDFSGVVGTIDLKSSVSATSVKTNDAITIKLTVSGTGNHKLMANPKLNVPTDFDQFDPKVTNDISNSLSGMVGTKSYEYLIIPRHSGQFTIPPITLSYFDINDKRYKQLSSGEVKITVEKGTSEESSSTKPQFATSREELKFIGKDIRYIKTDAGSSKLKPRHSFLLGSGLFYMLLLLPLLLFGAFAYYAQKQLHENNNIVLSRNKKATKVALKRLKKSAVLLKENKKEAFYDEVLRALWGYMSDKLSLPVSKLSRNNASELMQKRMVTDETIDRFMKIVDTCEFARYSPSLGSSEMDRLYHETIEAITLIEGEIKK
jgi:hypothetical protein